MQNNQIRIDPIYDDLLVLQENEFVSYQVHKFNEKISNLWHKFQAKFPVKFRKEVESKGFAIIPHKILEEDCLSKPYYLTVRNPSKELSDVIDKMENPIILVIKGLPDR
ncbi:hypothetical protein JW887_06725 [Candidatus Dojkabacteria bacterium]|nr:hypothetical protein [Candidatus Dojkabacteria bacterium]